MKRIISLGMLAAAAAVLGYGQEVGNVNAEVGSTKGINVLPRENVARRAHRMINLLENPGAVTGPRTINNIVIFVRFADESAAMFPDSIASYARLFNTAAPGANSTYTYFSEVSYGRLTALSTFYPTSGDNVLSYQDTRVRNYYREYNAVSNPVGYANVNDAVAREYVLLKNAVDAVSSQIPASLAVDSDGNGRVDNVCFILSGNAGTFADWVMWPHMDYLSSQYASINGVRVWGYTVVFRDIVLDPAMGVTVLCHEMFHSIGYTASDLYHYSFDDLWPVGKWDIMTYFVPNPPPHPSAYLKWKAGWIDTIPTITVPGRYTLSPLTSASNNCYKIPSPNSSTEYYVVEYRKSVGTFEGSIPGEGLLVYRINTTVAAARTGNAYGPPDEVYVYRPGGTLTANGTPDSAAFSSNSGRTSLTDATNPSCFLSNGSPGGLRITNVGSVGATISFTLEPTTSILDESTEVPRAFSLDQNYPNPFNPSTTIKFELPKSSDVRLSVYDMLGREVCLLVNKRRDAGVHEVRFDGTNLASGIYFYRLQAGDFVETKRLIVLK